MSLSTNRDETGDAARGGRTDKAGQASEAAEDVHESKTLEHGVRLGLAAYGLVHLVVAWVGIQLAFGQDSGTASSTGALSQLAGGTLGMLLLLVMAVGFLILVVWRLVEAAVGHRDETEDGTRLRKRAASLGKAVLYGYLAWSSFKLAIGGGSDGGSTDTTTAQVMQLSAGPVIVGLLGLAIVGYGLALVYRGLSEKFTEQLEVEGRTGQLGRAIVLTGKLGHCAKGAALGMVGGLFVWAAFTQDAKKSGGLDQALHRLLQAPAGTWLLLATALGIACYGVFCLARARHIDIS